jgi:hypothetical protein
MFGFCPPATETAEHRLSPESLKALQLWRGWRPADSMPN